MVKFPRATMDHALVQISTDSQVPEYVKSYVANKFLTSPLANVIIHRLEKKDIRKTGEFWTCAPNSLNQGGNMFPFLLLPHDYHCENEGMTDILTRQAMIHPRGELTR